MTRAEVTRPRAVIYIRSVEGFDDVAHASTCRGERLWFAITGLRRCVQF